MRIDGSAYVVDLSRPEEIGKESGAAGASRSLSGDTPSFDHVEISSGRLSTDQLKRDLAALPEVRLDRVATLRQSLQAGSYRVDSGVLAQRMMEAFRG
jgi:negative regulator of flagellin synthesis FlgM